MKKRVLSMLMALALCLTLLPAPAWAAEDAPEGSAIVQEEQEKAPAAESPAILEQAAENGIAVQDGGDSTVEDGQPAATGAPTEGGGQLTNTGEGEQPNSETDTRTEIWCVSKPDAIGRSYDGTTNGDTISLGTLGFTDGENSYTLTEGTDFNATKTFDSADAGNHSVTVELELIGDAATKYELKAGEETFTIGGNIDQGLS